jgi:hypothetical protein
MSKSRKARYSDEIKHQVISLYPLCLDVEDKIELAEKLQIESLHKLYNLASRLKVTKEYQDCYDPSGRWNIPGAYVPRTDTSAWRDRQPYDPEIFSTKDDEYVRKYYGKQHVEEIRYVRGYTETAILYRARHLGVRKACYYWDERRVSAWLGVRVPTLRSALKRLGKEVYPCVDIHGQVRITLVATEDIAQLLLHKGSWRKLLETGADEWFVREILESYILLREGNGEACKWVSHGRTCLNPLSEDGFDWFYDGVIPDEATRSENSRKRKEIVGRHYHPRDLSPRRFYELA